MSIGAVLDEAWTLFTRFFLRFFVLGLVVFAVVNLVLALIFEAVSSDDAGTALWLLLSASLADFVLIKSVTITVVNFSAAGLTILIASSVGRREGLVCPSRAPSPATV